MDQLDAALARAPAAQHVAILRDFTALFLQGAASYSDRQLEIFNGVMGRLIGKTDRSALLDISRQLATIGNAPASVICQLSRNDDIAIAGPVLEKSTVLTDENLIDVAKVKSQDHLSAIAGRVQVNEPVSDVLIQRGNADVTRRLLANQGARLSELCFVKLVDGARRDKTLAAAVARRKDVPPELQPFLKLSLG
jgi:uncharacterized protein (DUF2336 family)